LNEEEVVEGRNSKSKEGIFVDMLDHCFLPLLLEGERVNSLGRLASGLLRAGLLGSTVSCRRHDVDDEREQAIDIDGWIGR
jgi:hypothetical protein